MVLRHNYTRNPDTARAGVRYYQMRPLGEEEPPRSIFASEGTVTRDEALRLMHQYQLEPPARDVPRPFLLHRIVLAPSDEERPEDLREMTRQVMRELEKDKGIGLHWVAVEHRHTRHHHVHVMLFGAGEAESGELREVRLGRSDHARMKAEGAAYCGWEREERELWESTAARALEPERTEAERNPPASPDPARDERAQIPERGEAPTTPEPGPRTRPRELSRER